MIHIAICEDNLIHLTKIKTLIEDQLDQPYTIDSFQSSQDFLFVLYSKGCTYHIIFMDIHLDEHSGIELAQKVNQMNPDSQIIYISQYTQHVSTVYDTDHIYFIVKDTIDYFLPKALAKALMRLDQINTLYLTVSWNKVTHVILQKDIIFLERELRKTLIHTTTKTYYTSEKLSQILKRLNPAFAFCHGSHIINMMRVTHLEVNSALFDQGLTVPVSRSYYKNVKKSLLHFITDP